jgi:dTDP-4-dehydrorhamnose 3,5-epimerase
MHDNSKVFYAVDNFFDLKYDSGINYMDDSLQIDWPISLDSLIISDKDKHLPMLDI